MLSTIARVHLALPSPSQASFAQILRLGRGDFRQSVRDAQPVEVRDDLVLDLFGWRVEME